MKSILMYLMLLFIATDCTAQTKSTAVIDTMVCHNECIDKFVSTQTAQGKERIYAVYNDTKNDISELIPVTQSMMAYIKTCEQNKIKPNLAIRLRNGVITGLIRYKHKYVRRK